MEESDPARSYLLVVDNRDERIISPFQNWLVEEIISNAASSINVLTERDQVMPELGDITVRCSRTTRSMASWQFCCSRCPLGREDQWDSCASKALAHPAFQPFTWPVIQWQ